MTLSGLRDRAAAVDSLLAVARRETLMLAVAVDATDDDGAAIASARLRWAIGSARQLIAMCEDDPFMKHRAPRLDRVANCAQRWLVGDLPRSLHAISNLVERVAARAGLPAPVIDAEDATLVDLDLDELDLTKIVLRGATLTDVTARRVRCDAADARSVRLVRCQLAGSSFARAVFTGGAVEHCDLARANLEGTSWHHATLSHGKLRRALLIDARLDGAVFTGCDLRGADLGIARSPEVASLSGARFVGCDLRDTRWAGRDLGGATFFDCKLFGAHGAPGMAGVVIERPDLSPAADGSQIGIQDDVVASWRTMVGPRLPSPTMTS